MELFYCVGNNVMLGGYPLYYLKKWLGTKCNARKQRSQQLLNDDFVEKDEPFSK